MKLTTLLIIAAFLILTVGLVIIAFRVEEVDREAHDHLALQNKMVTGYVAEFRALRDSLARADSLARTR